VRVLALSIVNSLLLALGIISGACGGDGAAGPGEDAIAEHLVRLYEVQWPEGSSPSGCLGGVVKPDRLDGAGWLDGVGHGLGRRPIGEGERDVVAALVKGLGRPRRG
jgi:hypothetical protein